MSPTGPDDQPGPAGPDEPRPADLGEPRPAGPSGPRPPAPGVPPSGLARSIGVGFGVGVLVALVSIAFVALPLFFLASAVEPSRGLNRPFVRTGLVEVAVPLGCFIGAVTGVTIGVWYHRGGRMPAPDRGSRWGG